jgi:hypothetical protein
MSFACLCREGRKGTKRKRYLTYDELFKVVSFFGTLILAGIAMVLGIKEPLVWGFLSTAIGISP